MDIQRLRNLTTGRLHTEMSHIYQDIETLIGSEGIMTHHLPSAMRALEPFLQKRVLCERFWDGKYDVTHTGDYFVDPLNHEELKDFWIDFRMRMDEVWDQIGNKTVVVVNA